MGGPARGYDVEPGGNRFLMVQNDRSESEPAVSLVLVQNWFEELKRLVPTN